jgi:hypothetical protein
VTICHTRTPFALNRPHLGSLRLRSHLSLDFGFPLDVWEPVAPRLGLEPLLLSVGLLALVGKPPPSNFSWEESSRLRPLTGNRFVDSLRKGSRPRYTFGGRVNVFCSGNVYSETTSTNVITYWAISEGVALQGVTDPRGTTGIHATRKRGPRCSHPPIGGLTK